MTRAAAFWRNERGNMAVIGALVMVAMVGSSAMAVDLMSFYRQKRLLQTATDLASMAAAANPAQASAAVNATLAANGISATLVTLVPGSYVANLALPASARFAANASPSNAVRLTTQMTAPIELGSIFNMLTPTQPRVTIGAQATASTNNSASFGIGSRLASLNAGALNAVLSAATGSTVTLSLVDYNSLASAQVDLFSFSQALAARAGLSAGNYSGLLSANVSPSSAITTLQQDAGGSVTSAADAFLQQSEYLLSPSPLQIGQLASVGTFGNDLMATVPSLPLPTRALDLLTGLAALSTSGYPVSASITTGLSGLTAQMTVTIGEPAQSVVAGIPPATASTAQVRLQVVFALVIPGLRTAMVPIAVEAAHATAQLTAISCPVADNADATATLAVTPSLISAGLGTLPNLDAYLASLSSQAVPILSIPGLVVVSAASDATAGTVTTPLTFTMADVQAVTIKSVQSSAIASSLASTLIGQVQLNVTVLGLNLGTGPTITRQVTTALNLAAPTMDTILSGLVSSLGIGVGEADTWMSAITCGGAVLVN